MGKMGDPSAVIDSKARVMGVSGLRVVDASAFPFLPPGHPSAVVCKSISNLRCSLVDSPSLRICNASGCNMADFDANLPDMLAEKIANDILTGS